MRPVQLGPFGRLELRRCNESVVTCPFRTKVAAGDGPFETTFRCLEIRTSHEAAEWLGAWVTNPDDMMALRSAVAEDSLVANQLADQQVLEQLGVAVARRALCLTVQMPPMHATGVTGPPAVPESTARPPSHYQPRPPEPPPVPVRPADDFFDKLDGIQQAATLRAAAQIGAPFCEACEKARQERAMAAQ